MTTLEDIAADLAAIKEQLAAKEPEYSPWISGDAAAAQFAGFKNRAAYRKWARKHGVRPIIDDKANVWTKADIIKAREKQKR